MAPNLGRNIIITLIFLSIAGLPPFGGFFTKLYILQDIFILYDSLNWNMIIIVVLLASLILTANYLTYFASFFSFPFGIPFSLPSSIKGTMSNPLGGVLTSFILCFWLFV
jgi:formate hydrogenlyase subunit 3/multisubunit Na+/H+ antiporter MnhD subunit